MEWSCDAQARSRIVLDVPYGADYWRNAGSN